MVAKISVDELAPADQQKYIFAKAMKIARVAATGGLISHREYAAKKAVLQRLWSAIAVFTALRRSLCRKFISIYFIRKYK
ncbi:MAG: hypothetical protein ABJH63_06750 [Rhizobiaceae bacterium]